MTTHRDQAYPPLLVQGQTWEEMTVGSAFRTAARPVPPRPRSLEFLAHELRWLQDISADLARPL
jgi:hypothetical protein